MGEDLDHAARKACAKAREARRRLADEDPGPAFIRLLLMEALIYLEEIEGAITEIGDDPKNE